MASLESVDAGNMNNVKKTTSVNDGNINDNDQREGHPITDNANKEFEDGDETLETEKGNGIIRIPLARIKKIMKADPSLGILSQDSVFLIAKATELFIESLVVESYQNMASSKKKTLSRRDFDSCVESIDSLAFLDGAIDE